MAFANYDDDDYDRHRHRRRRRAFLEDWHWKRRYRVWNIFRYPNHRINESAAVVVDGADLFANAVFSTNGKV